MMNSMMKRWILALGAVMLGVTACVSPLDTDAPRKETPLTPAPTVEPLRVTTNFEFSGHRYELTGTPVFKIDTTVSPIVFWMDFQMIETSTPSTAVVEEFRVTVDSLPAVAYPHALEQGEVRLWATFTGTRQLYPSDAATNLATMLIGEYPREPGQPRKVTITLYLVANANGFFPGAATEEVFGTIDLEI
ncbi:MAG: hypothetical protein ACO3I4_04155 [Candidatus Kapaibacteriota bacterium]